MTTASARRGDQHRGRPGRPGRPALAGGALAGGALAGLGACGGAMDARSAEAGRTASLTVLMVVLGTFVFTLVVALLGVALARQRTEGRGNRLIALGGVALPAVILPLLVGLAVWVGQAGPDGDDALVIEITGHQYWWDVRYPDEGVRTANEVHLPVGRPVELRLRSADAIHSFWAPQLAGKRDLVPARTNRLTVQLDEAGRLPGYCAEFCGIQHANMRIDVVGHEPEDFTRWLADQRAPAPVHDDGPLLEGQELFLGSSCVYCHAVDGTNASSERGPDLTHLMSRERIGAGVLPLTTEALGDWIRDPQAHKPGNQMPPTELTDDELDALVAYMESLR